MVLDLQNIHKQKHKIYFEELKGLLTENLIEFLCFDHSWLTTLSTQQKFCWIILSTCCSKIIISYENFDWAKRYCSIIKELNLSLIFSHYCKEKKLTGNDCLIASELPKEIKVHQSKDVYRYINLVWLVYRIWERRDANCAKFLRCHTHFSSRPHLFWLITTCPLDDD